MISTFRHHWPAFVLAFLVGAFLVSPAIWFKINYGTALRSPANIRAADEFFYLARIRDVIDGYPLSGNPFILEYKSRLPGHPVFLGEYISAAAIRLSGLDAAGGNILLDFLFPIAAALLAYACFFAITQKRWLSFFGTALIFFGFFTSDFARTPSPQLNFLFWLSLFLILYLLAGRPIPSPARYAVIFIAAVNFGLLFYLYTYYWTFYLAFFGIAFLLALASKWHEYARSVAGIAVGGLIVAIPYFLLMARAFFRPEYIETARRIGMIDSHFPSGVAIILPAFLLLLLTGLLLRSGFLAWNQLTLFFVSGVIAAALSVNQHVLTGKNFEFSSHYYMLSVFWFLFYASYLAAVFFQRVPNWEKAARGLAAVALIFLIPYGLFLAKDRAFYSFPARRASLERYFPLLDWLENNTAKDSVVYAPAELSSLIPIYTEDNVFFASSLQSLLMPDEEIIDRFIVSNYYQEPFDRHFVLSQMRFIYGGQFVNAAAHARQENVVRSFLGLQPKAAEVAPQWAVARVLERSGQLRSLDFEEALKRYRVDYLVWDRAAKPEAKFDEFAFLKPIYSQAGLTIYKVL